MHSKLTIFHILNILNIPQNYKIGLAESYYKVITATVLEQFPLTEQEIENAVQEKQEIIEVVSKKYPSLLENQEFISAITKINTSFIELLMSLADERNKQTISDLITNTP